MTIKIIKSKKLKLSKKQSQQYTKKFKNPLVSILITIWITTSLTGVGFYFSGHVSAKNLQTGITVVSKVIISCLEFITAPEFEDNSEQ